MKRNQVGAVLSGVIACAVFAAYAETYKMSGQDSPGTTSFNEIGKWVLNSNTSVKATEPPCRATTISRRPCSARRTIRPLTTPSAAIP